MHLGILQESIRLIEKSVETSVEAEYVQCTASFISRSLLLALGVLKGEIPCLALARF